MNRLKPLEINSMDVEQCEEAQRDLLYPWEVEGWKNAALDWSDNTSRSKVMDILDRRINIIKDRQAAVNGAQGSSFLGFKTPWGTS